MVMKGRGGDESDDEDERYNAAGRESRIREGIAAGEITLASSFDGLHKRDVQ